MNGAITQKRQLLVVYLSVHIKHNLTQRINKKQTRDGDLEKKRSAYMSVTNIEESEESANTADNVTDEASSIQSKTQPFLLGCLSSRLRCLSYD